MGDRCDCCNEHTPTVFTVSVRVRDTPGTLKIELCHRCTDEVLNRFVKETPDGTRRLVRLIDGLKTELPRK